MKKMISILLLLIVTAGVLTGCGQDGQTDKPGQESPAPAAKAAYTNPATVSGEEQTVTTSFSSRGYVPITVQVGVPVKWTIRMEEGDITGCNNELIIPKYNIDQPLSAGDTVIEFTPEETGKIPYSCWMGMIRSSITVVDDLTND